MQQATFTPVAPDGPTACVWEFDVHSHERDSLMDHILARPQRPDTAVYPAEVISIAAGSEV